MKSGVADLILRQPLPRRSDRLHPLRNPPETLPTLTQPKLRVHTVCRTTDVTHPLLTSRPAGSVVTLPRGQRPLSPPPTSWPAPFLPRPLPPLLLIVGHADNSGRWLRNSLPRL